MASQIPVGAIHDSVCCHEFCSPYQRFLIHVEEHEHDDGMFIVVGSWMGIDVEGTIFSLFFKVIGVAIKLLWWYIA